MKKKMFVNVRAGVVKNCFIQIHIFHSIFNLFVILTALTMLNFVIFLKLALNLVKKNPNNNNNNKEKNSSII